MTHLSVNLNKVALLRNARTLAIPSVTHAAALVLDAGAYGVTVHPRPDERHIRRTDVSELAVLLAARAVNSSNGASKPEFNIEGNPFHGLLDLVSALQTTYPPQQCTLVPDEAGAFTSDHGWDLEKDGEKLKPVIAALHGMGARVSLFMDAEPHAMARAKALGAERVELYTEPYARAFGTADEPAVTARYVAAGAAARAAGLELNAGHDLNRDNLPKFIAAVPGVMEVSIGHALIADALEFGLAETVRLYLKALS